MKKFKSDKNWINMSNVNKEVDEQEEIKEEKEMGFFKNHKKHLIVGGLIGLTTLNVGLWIASIINNSNGNDEFCDFDEDDEDAEITSEF